MEGKCVRLVHGEKSRRTTYYDNPAEVALRWHDAGARWLHVIDLDATIDQKPLANFETVEKILTSITPLGMKVQIGGGIREKEHIRKYLDLGAARVIFGTKALESEEFTTEIFAEFGAGVALALDSKDGMVALKGWTDVSAFPTEEFAKKMNSLGARTMIVTDITRDGTLTEPNFAMMDKLCGLVNSDIIASGGVSALEHIERLTALGRRNLEGAVVGKALYEGKFDLAKAVALYQG